MIPESVTVSGVEVGIDDLGGDDLVVTVDLRNTRPSFLAPAEARRVADVLHDYADQCERGGVR